MQPWTCLVFHRVCMGPNARGPRTSASISPSLVLRGCISIHRTTPARRRKTTGLGLMKLRAAPRHLVPVTGPGVTPKVHRFATGREGS